ncbi:MAG: hypothetical protein VX278_17005, partial [Myxococcota bacterium]|nr:hypothetical protein [Myxococcota bacterium]
TMLARNRDVHHPKPRLPRQTSEGYLQQKGFRWLLYHKGVLRDKDAACTQTWLNENCAEKKESADVTLCTLPSF